MLVVPPDGSPEFVAPLSVAWLRELGDVDADLVDLLGRLGVRTLGALAALDAGDVLARFGSIGARAHRIAVRARRAARRRPPTRQPEWWVEHPFDEPVEQLDTVVFVAKRLADDLVVRLAADGRVCVRLVIVVETEHGERCERVVVPRPRAVGGGDGRACPLAARGVGRRSRAGSAVGSRCVRLVPDEVRPDDGVQTRLWGGRSQADDDAARAVVRLTGLAGEQAVRVPVWQGGRLPGDRYRLVPAVSVDLDDPSGRLDRGAGPWPGSMPTPSPAIVPREPIAVDVVDDDGQPGAGQRAG